MHKQVQFNKGKTINFLKLKNIDPNDVGELLVITTEWRLPCCRHPASQNIMTPKAQPVYSAPKGFQITNPAEGKVSKIKLCEARYYFVA